MPVIKTSFITIPRAAERIGGGGGANTKIGAPEALFCACTQYIYTSKLLSSISGFRSKSTMYRALASILRGSCVR